MKKSLNIFVTILTVLVVFFTTIQLAHTQNHRNISKERQIYFDRLMSFLEVDDGIRNNPRAIKVSPQDPDWMSWVKRTGELPPDFSKMPSIYTIPDPLIMDQNGKNIPIENVEKWIKQKEWLSQQIQHWITGTIPPPPDNLKVEVIHENHIDGVINRHVKLFFGPEQKATLNLELLIPSGKGPFPVFLTQHVHKPWGHIAVRRGYIACMYAGNDSWDDADAWAEIYYPKYDFSLLMRRAWAAHRAVDYLYTLNEVDKQKIGIAGHSRNGKQSLLAAAFDDRIAACIPSSAGTGGELSFRHTREEYTVETIKVLTGQTTAWFHPRLRFFVGNEYKLPVDQNTLMALVAPRHLMISTAFTEPYGNPWGAEQMYHSVKKVYQFLGAEDKLAIRLRLGGHGTLPFIIEEYLDFFDYAFERKAFSLPKDLLWDYSFEDWKKKCGETISPFNFPEKSFESLLINNSGHKISSKADWEEKKSRIIENIEWSLGNKPDLVKQYAPMKISALDDDQNYFDVMIERPGETDQMGRKTIEGIGGMGSAYLYYPKSIDDNQKIPVLIYLHEYSYSSGFTPTWPYTSAFSIDTLVSQGMAVLCFDLMGMGSRIKEGTDFYQRYPKWSKLGNMVSNVRDAVTLLTNLDVINAEEIYVAGYSLGGTVSLYSAALDDRIKAVAAFGAFSPLRTATEDKGVPGLQKYSHIHGLQPRFGFFVGNENRLPVDFDEIISSIAPRKLLLISPRYDQDANITDIKKAVDVVEKVYTLYDANDQLEFIIPEYYNQFTESQFRMLLDWLGSN